MRMLFGTALFVVALLTPSYLAFAGVISWTDREGNMHVTEDISKVPLEYRSQAKSWLMEGDSSSVPTPIKFKDHQPSSPESKKKKDRGIPEIGLGSHRCERERGRILEWEGEQSSSGVARSAGGLPILNQGEG